MVFVVSGMVAVFALCLVGHEMIGIVKVVSKLIGMLLVLILVNVYHR